jgi:glucosamine-6-phosphate deaminase
MEGTQMTLDGLRKLLNSLDQGNVQVKPIKVDHADRLKVKVYEDRNGMGAAAAQDVASKMQELLSQKEEIRMVFASAPSQNEFLAALSAAEGIDWSRVVVFHMDDYIGLPEGAPQKFATFIRHHLFDKVKPGQIHLIESSQASTIEQECKRYGKLLDEAPIDIICFGIGENGHIAFNDPPVADFNDTAVIKPVELDDACRQQQVNDGCFSNFAAVPRHAITLTIPALLSGSHLFCIVPGQTKRDAVSRTINGPITTDCPASILRTHRDCTLYVDVDSYGIK